MSNPWKLTTLSAVKDAVKSHIQAARRECEADPDLKRVMGSLTATERF